MGEDMVLRINKLFGIIIFILFFIMLTFSDLVVAGAKNGIDMSLNILIPTMFPYTVLSLMFLKSGGFHFLSKFLGVKYALWLVSSIGGYPAGALLICELKGKIPNDFSKKAILYSVNAGPSFILAAVGIKIFNSIYVGLLLLFSHLFISFLFCVFSKDVKQNTDSLFLNGSPFSNLFESLESALKSIVKICGLVIFIACFYELVKNIPFFNKISLITEVTVGVMKAQKNLYLTAFLLSFSGISVIMQVKMILKDLISLKALIFYRLLHGVLSAVCMWICCKIFPISFETISNGIDFNKGISYISLSSGIALIFMCLIFIAEILRQKNNRENHG